VRFGIITDIHLGWDDLSLRNLQAALVDLQALDLDLLVILGDMADMRLHCWPLVDEHILAKLTLPTIFVRGNADFQAGGEEAWAKHIARPSSDAIGIGGVHFVAVGAQSEDHVLPVGDAAIAFIREEMAAHAGEAGVVLCHAPVRNTTYWSCDNDVDHCLVHLLGPSNPPFRLQLKDSEAMASALQDARNVRLFLTGHVHNDHRLVCDHGYGPWAEKDGVLHITTANLGGWAGVGVPRNEGRVIEIGPEEVVVQVRNVVDRCFVPELELRFATARPSS
jgi:3',5'-cyclic AMP phosphodiesterase CpdA